MNASFSSTISTPMQVYCAAVVDPSQRHAVSIVLKLLHGLLAVAFNGASANGSAVLSELPSNRSAFCAFQAGSGLRAGGGKGGSEEGDGAAAVGQHPQQQQQQRQQQQQQQQRGEDSTGCCASPAVAMVSAVGQVRSEEGRPPAGSATAAGAPAAACQGAGAGAATGAARISDASDVGAARISDASDVGAEVEGGAAQELGGLRGGSAVARQATGPLGGGGMGDDSGSAVRRNSWQRIESVALLPGLLGAMAEGEGERRCFCTGSLLRTKECTGKDSACFRLNDTKKCLNCFGSFHITTQHELNARKQALGGVPRGVFTAHWGEITVEVPQEPAVFLDVRWVPWSKVKVAGSVRSMADANLLPCLPKM